MEDAHICVLPLSISTQRNLRKKPYEGPLSSQLVNLSTPGLSLSCTSLGDSHGKGKV